VAEFPLKQHLAVKLVLFDLDSTPVHGEPAAEVVDSAAEVPHYLRRYTTE